MVKNTESGNTRQTNPKTTVKLYRSEKDKVIGGVCGGLGDFFQIDVAIVRLIFILTAIFGGGGVLFYLILWLIIPSKKDGSEITKENIEKNAEEMRDKAKGFVKDINNNTTGLNSSQIFGMAIVIFGVLLLLGNLGVFNITRLWKYFPSLFIIVLGLTLLKKHR